MYFFYNKEIWNCMLWTKVSETGDAHVLKVSFIALDMNFKNKTLSLVSIINCK